MRSLPEVVDETTGVCAAGLHRVAISGSPAAIFGRRRIEAERAASGDFE